MGKVAPDLFIDGALDYAAGADMYTVASGSPATFTDAYTTLMLARVAVSSGCFVKADDTSGRKLTMATKTGISITNSGDALAVCLVNAAGSTLRYVTTCTQQTLTAAGTVDIPTWKINIQDPT